MKDAKNHLKHLQKKVIRSSKNEAAQDSSYSLPKKEREVNFKRPKFLLNKRKTA